LDTVDWIKPLPLTPRESVPEEMTAENPQVNQQVQVYLESSHQN